MEKKLMIIADQSEISKTILKSILDEEFDILDAASFKEMYQLFNDHKNDVSLCLIDYKLINEATNKAKNISILSYLKSISKIPFIFMTPSVNSVMKSAIKDGAFSIITKPFIPNSVIEVIHYSLRKNDLDNLKEINDRLINSYSKESYLNNLLKNIKGSIVLLEISQDDRYIPVFTNNDFYESAKSIIDDTNKQKFLNDFKFNIIPEDLLVFKKAFKDHLEGREKEIRSFFRVVNLENKISYIKIFGVLVDYPFSSNKAVLCTLQDNTDIVSIQLKSEERKRELTKVVENLPGGLLTYVSNKEHRLVYASNKFYEDFKLTKEEFMDMYEGKFSRLVANSSYASLQSFLSKVFLEKKEARENINFMIDGKETLFFVKGFSLSDNKRSAYYFIFINMSYSVTMERQIKDAKETYNYITTHDTITRLINRREFMRIVSLELKDKEDVNYSLIRVNIRNFKAINSKYGYDVGDIIIKKVSDIILNGVKKSEGYVTRISSDNFAVFIRTDCLYKNPLGSIITIKVSDEIVIPVSLYYGIYYIKRDEYEVAEIIDKAEFAMHMAKNEVSKSLVKYSEELEIERANQLNYCEEALQAMANHEFKIFLQPVYNASTKEMVSAEALVRWVHPQKGIIPPNKFIPVFEEKRLIINLDLYMIEEVLKYLKDRNKRGLVKLPISVNLSRISFYSPSIVSNIVKLTDKYEIDHSLLHIEITESAYIDNEKLMLETITELKNNGFVILMDDFGSGYSSLNIIKDIPFDIMKIDMRFLESFDSINSKSSAVLNVIVQLAKALNLQTIAEGVETKSQVEFLNSIECPSIQGYYFSKPLPIEKFEKLKTKLKKI